METDGRYMMRNNYRYSVSLLDWCQDNDVPFLYASSASVYGGSRRFARSARARRRSTSTATRSSCSTSTCGGSCRERTAQVAGFRYFNVYGPREQHKGRMASVVLHFFEQYRADGRVRLFEGAGGYAAGEQRRDFVSVEDVVKVNLDFLDHPERSGIFNLGTGGATTYNDVARATINAVRRAGGEPELALPDLVAAGAITYVPFPPALAGKYQSHTQADLARLRAAGYRAPMLSVAEGVPRYVERLISGSATSA